MNKTAIALGAVITLAAAATSVSAQPADPCDRPAESHRLQVRVNNNQAPEGVEMGGRDAGTLRVCPGDRVEWHYTGLPFRIYFRGQGPFEAELEPANNGKVEGVVSANGTRGKSFKYDVVVEGGGILDPVIIVD